MPKEETTPATEQQPPAKEEDNSTPPATEPKAPEATKLSDGDYFPRSYVEELRTEAANWRTKYQDVQKKLEGAKSQEDIDAITASLQEENEQLRRDLVAARYSLPKELADRLKGSTDEELEADAKALAALVKTPEGGDDEEDDEPPRGGRNPKERKDVVTADQIVARQQARRSPF